MFFLIIEPIEEIAHRKLPFQNILKRKLSILTLSRRQICFSHTSSPKKISIDLKNS